MVMVVVFWLLFDCRSGHCYRYKFTAIRIIITLSNNKEKWRGVGNKCTSASWRSRQFKAASDP